jgi:hypothetical protein
MKIIKDVLVLIADGTEDAHGDKVLADRVAIAEQIRVSVNFQHPVGKAMIRREGDKFIADLEILENLFVGGLYPAVGGSLDPRTQIVSVCEIGLGKGNADKRIPPILPALRKLNDMFSVDSEGYLVKTSNGERVPDDEPLFILRGRDNASCDAIGSYIEAMYDAGTPEDRIEQVNAVLDRFRTFAVEHQDRMKIPGITRGK